MQAVKLRPEELLGGPVRSDWLLLWRLLPRGLPSKGDALLGAGLGTCCPGGVDEGGWDPSVGWGPVGVSSSPRLEEKTRSKEGSLSIHSTLDMGRQLKRICEGWTLT